MTDIQALKDRVVEAAKAHHFPGRDHISRARLGDAVDALNAAEEAAKQPRLMTPQDRMCVVLKAGGIDDDVRVPAAVWGAVAISHDRADILAKARQRARLVAVLNGMPDAAISLGELEALLEGR